MSPVRLSPPPHLALRPTQPHSHLALRPTQPHSHLALRPTQPRPSHSRQTALTRACHTARHARLSRVLCEPNHRIEWAKPHRTCAARSLAAPTAARRRLPQVCDDRHSVPVDVLAVVQRRDRPRVAAEPCDHQHRPRAVQVVLTGYSVVLTGYSVVLTGYSQNRAIINTVLALCSSCIVAFIMDNLLRPKNKFSMVLIDPAPCCNQAQHVATQCSLRRSNGQHVLDQPSSACRHRAPRCSAAQQGML